MLPAVSLLGFPTRRRLRLFLLIFAIAVFGFPSWVFVSQIITRFSPRSSYGRFTTVVRVERSGTTYHSRTLAFPRMSPPDPNAVLIGEVRMTLDRTLSTDGQHRPMYTELRHASEWSPARPTDDVIDAIVRDWGDPSTDQGLSRYGPHPTAEELREILKSPSGRTVERHWGNILRASAADALDVLLGCSVFSIPILVVAYLAVRLWGYRGDACWKCGYSTKDLAGSICPECGTNLSQPPA